MFAGPVPGVRSRVKSRGQWSAQYKDASGKQQRNGLVAAEAAAHAVNAAIRGSGLDGRRHKNPVFGRGGAARPQGAGPRDERVTQAPPGAAGRSQIRRAPAARAAPTADVFEPDDGDAEDLSRRGRPSTRRRRDWAAELGGAAVPSAPHRPPHSPPPPLRRRRQFRRPRRGAPARTSRRKMETTRRTRARDSPRRLPRVLVIGKKTRRRRRPQRQRPTGGGTSSRHPRRPAQTSSIVATCPPGCGPLTGHVGALVVIELTVPAEVQGSGRPDRHACRTLRPPSGALSNAAGGLVPLTGPTVGCPTRRRNPSTGRRGDQPLEWRPPARSMCRHDCIASPRLATQMISTGDDGILGNDVNVETGRLIRRSGVASAAVSAQGGPASVSRNTNWRAAAASTSLGPRSGRGSELQRREVGCRRVRRTSRPPGLVAPAA